ncbi:hypothetical protein HYN49_03620 [Flavobacterium pallidum]|uniref:Uncharacterized protein n=1 Tax=Flavobacterium pallidum TaxID=2172098 RepID=A0A2S1SF93_9FLAO|nr:hypothetical protein HYN49_03620 [Flavobacterium pallidum]
MLLGITLILYIKIIAAAIRNRNKAKPEKKWLFEDIINRYGSISAFLFFPLQAVSRMYDSTVFQSNTALWIAASSLVVYSLLVYVVVVLIPLKAKHYLTEMYPEYSVAKV